MTPTRELAYDEVLALSIENLAHVQLYARAGTTLDLPEA